MIYDLMIKNGTVVTPDGPIKADIAVQDGKIAALLKGEPDSLEEASATPDLKAKVSDREQEEGIFKENPVSVFDASGCVIFPGGVDVHVHMEDLGAEDFEDWSHGSYAAALGGTTTVVDMPIDCIPSTVNRETVQKKLKRIEGRSYVDYLLWGGLSSDNKDEIPGMLKEGVAGLKAFRIECGIEDYHRTPDDVLRETMELSVKRHFPLMIHAENEAMNRAAIKAHEWSEDYSDWTYMQPAEGEAKEVGFCADLARETGAKVHIAHVSNRLTLKEIRRAKAEGARVTCETCPHYLLFTVKDYGEKGPALKCAPPVREPEDLEALWEALKDGTIDMVSSDHSPNTVQAPTPYVKDAWAGVSGLQQNLLCLYGEGHVKRGMSLEMVAKIFSTNAAKLLGIADRTGSIEVGKSADLTILDPNQKTCFDEATIQTKIKEGIYLGETMTGKIVATFLRGEKICHGAPKGKYIPKHYVGM